MQGAADVQMIVEEPETVAEDSSPVPLPPAADSFQAALPADDASMPQSAGGRTPAAQVAPLSCMQGPVMDLNPVLHEQTMVSLPDAAPFPAASSRHTVVQPTLFRAAANRLQLPRPQAKLVTKADAELLRANPLPGFEPASFQRPAGLQQFLSAMRSQQGAPVVRPRNVMMGSSSRPASSAVVLELCSGSGKLCSFFRAAGLEAIGVDCERNRFQKLAPTFCIDLSTSEGLEAVLLLLSSYDVYSCTQVFPVAHVPEHVSDQFH